ncbi:hypothetical protein [Streptomyces sp. NPDC085540]|uniref:hypothetical protein n=1 Tax=Streptomyces sp. NPDC085540 TaxID=3365730 RepID=UPI0037CF1B5D
MSVHTPTDAATLVMDSAEGFESLLEVAGTAAVARWENAWTNATSEAAHAKPLAAFDNRPTWDKLKYADKHTGRRRICLNLGPGTRYIIFGTIDAQAVCRAVHPDDHAHCFPHTQDYRDYVASGRPIRIIRIRLAPGEGYIAPTEYLLHDGSTEAQDQPSAAAFWLGHWPRGILPSRI